MSEDFLFTLRRTFREEAGVILEQLEDKLLGLSEAGFDTEQVNGLFREAHTLKGSALAVEFTQVGELAHVVEELFSLWRDQKVRVTPAQIRWALSAVEMLREELARALRAEDTNVRDSRTGGQKAEGDRTISVAIERLDQLLDLVGEVVVSKERLSAIVARPGVSMGEVKVAQQDAEVILDELQDRVMSLRLVSMAPTLRRLARVAQDVAQKQGKKVHFHSNAYELEVDAGLVDALRDPLLHMIRNSVDHGIEPPARRQAAGKEAHGLLSLFARREAGSLVIELQDDGAGLNRGKLAQKASDLGLHVTPETISDELLGDLIFRPGLSTADTVTDVSGRGVGMDVVRDSIRRLRGSVEVTSQEGEGTHFVIRVPLALAIMDGFRFLVGGQSFVVPADVVEECLSLPEGARGRRLFELRGRTTPCIDLADYFGLPSSVDGRKSIVIVAHPSGPVGLEVDHLIGKEQTVIKPMGPFFSSMNLVSGSAVLGTGEVAVILDVPQLLELIMHDSAAE